MTTSKQNRIIANSPIYYGWVIWLVATIGWIATSPAQSFTFSLFFDFFIEDFGLSRTAVSTAYALGTFLASLSLAWVGRLVDRYGNHRMSIVIAVLFSGALVLFSMVTGPFTLVIGFLALRGLGQGSLSLVNTTVIAEWFQQLRGRVMSVSLVLFALFQGIYVPAIQRLLEVRDWREVWVMLGLGVAVIVIPLSVTFLRNTPEEFGLVPDGNRKRKDKNADSIINTEAAWTLGETLRTPLFWAFIFGRVLPSAWGTGLVIHQISLFEGLGHTARIAAETYAMSTLITAASALVFGWLVDNIPPGRVMVIQLGALIGACFMATIMTTQTLLVVYAIMLGIVMGGGVFDSAVWVNIFGRAHQGSIRGFVSTMLVAGTSIGPILFGLSFDLTGNYDLILWVGAGLCVLASILALIVPLPVHEDTSPKVQ